jgi:hypothetical protein
MIRRRVATLIVLGSLLAPASAAAKTLSQTVSGAIDATNVHYRSTLLSVSPVTPGVTWKVLDLNDEIDLINHSHETVTAFGYDGERYVRILAGGAVQVNENSPAYYLNQSFFAGGVQPPPNATAGATPDWVTVANTGSFVWHDHRIHWYSNATPFVVKDVHKTTLVERWTVPIEVGDVRGALYGKLVWIGEKPFSFPVGAIIAFVVILIASVAFVVVVRRRRAAGGGSQKRPTREAW